MKTTHSSWLTAKITTRNHVIQTMKKKKATKPNWIQCEKTREKKYGQLLATAVILHTNKRKFVLIILLVVVSSVFHVDGKSRKSIEAKNKNHT